MSLLKMPNTMKTQTQIVELLLIANTLLAILAGNAMAQTYPVASPAGTNQSPYPHLDLAPGYRVDPSWPKRPPEIGLGQVPSIAIDRQDNVWVYTRTNPAVQVFSPEGQYLFGWRAEKTNAAAHAIKIDQNGFVWLVDVGLHVVRKHTREGQLLLTLGTEGEAGDDTRHFNKPTDVALASNGEIFVTDGYGNSRVMHFDQRGRFINSWGSPGVKPGQFSIVHAIVCDSRDRLYIADRNNVRVQVFNTRGKLLDVWPNLMVPWTFWLAPKDEIWVCGSSPMHWGFDPKYPTAPLGCPPKDQLIMKFNTQGKALQLWTFPKAPDGAEKPGELNWLHAIAFDSKGNLYLGDIIGSRVQKFVPVAPARSF